MSNPRIKRVRNPTFPEEQLNASLGGVNPVLLKGEIVCLLDGDTNKVTAFKIGDGFNRWDDLPFQGDTLYPHSDLVTNQIGDVLLGTSQQGRLLSDIVKDFISPYAVPAVSNVRTNADGSNFLNVSQLEIGQSLGSAISLTFNVSNQSNLDGATPVTIDTGGIFIEANPYANLPISITPVGVLNPSNPVVYTIKVKVAHLNGESSWATCTIRWDTRLLWGASALADLTTNQHALDLIPSGGQGIKQGYFDDYQIGSAGYGYVLIPSVLLSGAPPIIWTEVSDPNAPASLEMVNLGVLTVNNGIGTYNYTKYRTPFNNLEGIILRAS